MRAPPILHRCLLLLLLLLLPLAAVARRLVPLPGPLRSFGWLFGGVAIDEFFATQFEHGPLKRIVCDADRSENNRRLKRCKLKLREARAEVKAAKRNLEIARNTRDIYLKELLERAKWDRYQKEHHMRKPHFLSIPSGREVQNNLHDAEQVLAHALGDRTKAEIEIHEARVADRHYRKYGSVFCLDIEV